jgi:arylsulfatase A-like enzyme
MAKLSRRDFLKAATLFTAGALTSWNVSGRQPSEDGPNIVIILMDALSALHTSLHGYPRETTPNMARFAKRCTVYNQHYSGSNFTSSGTAAMLTGMNLWKNRVFNQGGLYPAQVVPNNPYRLLGKGYRRMAFSQNFWADRLLAQYYYDIDEFLPQTAYSMRGNTLVKSWVGKDRFLASIAFDEFLFAAQSDLPASSLLGYLYKSRVAHAIETQNKAPDYPRGFPEIEGYALYNNERVYAGVFDEIMNLRTLANGPYFGYFHLFSPHAPYRPNSRFSRSFVKDGFKPKAKPVNPNFAAYFYEPEEDVLKKRLLYDQQVAQVDAELGKLLEKLEAQGVLEDTYIIVTSDHGETFERGFAGHGGLVMYEPVIRIPLLIHAPGQETRQDIDTPTSNIDLLPTLLQIAGKEIPGDLEGKVLPGFGGQDTPGRSIFSMCAWENSTFQPLTKAAFAMRKGNYKLLAYPGYAQEGSAYELYDLVNDPEERREISAEQTHIFTELKAEFEQALDLANQPYARA